MVPSPKLAAQKVVESQHALHQPGQLLGLRTEILRLSTYAHQQWFAVAEVQTASISGWRPHSWSG